MQAAVSGQYFLEEGLADFDGHGHSLYHDCPLRMPMKYLKYGFTYT